MSSSDPQCTPAQPPPPDPPHQPPPLDPPHQPLHQPPQQSAASAALAAPVTGAAEPRPLSHWSAEEDAATRRLFEQHGRHVLDADFVDARLLSDPSQAPAFATSAGPGAGISDDCMFLSTDEPTSLQQQPPPPLQQQPPWLQWQPPTFQHQPPPQPSMCEFPMQVVARIIPPRVLGYARGLRYPDSQGGLCP